MFATGLQEPEIDICASMLDALNESIQVGIMHFMMLRWLSLGYGDTECFSCFTFKSKYSVTS